ncbi:ATP-binding protein [Dactylosporangium darangshiense]|uniref:ATP-binding protein n=1 Tax=Dactylosporangium darangshiense TaxID=579108 RepID=UPI0031E51C8C
MLGLRPEREYPVAPLPLPADPTGVPVGELAASPAVALFIDRARAVRHDFALTGGNAAAVVGICRRLDGLPLAIELAAARIRLLDPDALLRRLVDSLDALGTGTVDLPERQRTLRATVAWSVGLLDDAERSLLEVAAVFEDGWTVDAAAQVAGLDGDRALELFEALARQSLVSLDNTDHGPRLRMLETVRAFIAGRLAARPDLALIQRRRSDYYRALTEQADRPLRGAGHSEWAERLQTEEGNVAATVEWYLAHDRAPLPHLFRVLWPFWEQRDHLSKARWVEELLPTADSLDHQARAELLWTALVTASDMGDDPAALDARQRLEPLLAGIQDPYLQAVSQLAMVWTAPIVGDLDGALRRVSASLEQLRGQDEPYWTAVAVASAGNVETAAGRYDEALRRLSEARELADQFDNDWLAAWLRVQLGTLAVVRGRPDEARALLDKGLDRSSAAHSTPLVSMCLVGFARLALAEGDPERAARLAGAADGLRRRVGQRAWPLVRRSEAELVDQARQAVGADRFDYLYAAGCRLNQREAVAAVRDRSGAVSPS